MTITILDGGMGRQLARMGAPFRQPEWSALALLDGPDWVARAHRSFIEAGADVITTNAYAVVPFHIGDERFAARGRELAALAGRLAREEADAAGRPVRVAGSLPPLFGSYRPDLFVPERAPALLAELVAGQAPYVDLWLAETQSSIAEATAAADALAGDDRPAVDLLHARRPSRRRAPAAVGRERGRRRHRGSRLGAQALLFNCSQPERMAAAIAAAAAAAPGLPLGAYANAFPAIPDDHEANDALFGIRTDLDPDGYCAFARAGSTPARP